MPEITQTQTMPITFGPCPQCQAPIRLRLIEPDRPDHEKRTYQCDACGYSESKTVSTARSATVGPFWIAGKTRLVSLGAHFESA
jgi:hypothetical protein